MNTNAQKALIANVVGGVVGAAAGGWLATQLGISGGQVVSLILAVIGAAVLIAILKAAGILKQLAPRSGAGQSNPRASLIVGAVWVRRRPVRSCRAAADTPARREPGFRHEGPSGR